MATNFPNSPSNGDTHAGFTYNSTTGAWESSATVGEGQSPIVYTEPPTSHTLNKDGSTSTVQMQAVDPEGLRLLMQLHMQMLQMHVQINWHQTQQ